MKSNIKSKWYRIIKWILIVLTACVSVHAFWGGFHFLLDPTGATLHLNQYIGQLPFGENYFYFGIMLIVINGFSQITTTLLLLMHNNYGGIVAGISAGFLLIWACVQLFYIGLFFYSGIHIVTSLLEIVGSIWLCVLYKELKNQPHFMA